MKLRKIVGITSLILFLGCQASENIKIGTYEIVRMNRIEMGFRYIFQNVRGTLCTNNKLNLKADSSFEFFNYPFISLGRWSFKNDSLCLNISDSQWQNDSLKSIFPPDRTPIASLQPVFFRVNGENLIRIRPLSNNKKAIVKLKLKQPIDNNEN